MRDHNMDKEHNNIIRREGQDMGKEGIRGVKAEMSDEIFQKISKLVHEKIGLKLTDKKKYMVYSRLSRRLRELGLTNFNKYYQLLKKDTSELEELINLLTTNVTNFFREIHHFAFLKNRVFTELKQEKHNKKIRVWSAGCSSGEEAYSLAIILYDHFGPEWDIKILATDINTEVLNMAREGIYNYQQVKNIPYNLLSRYFLMGTGDNEGLFKVKDDIKKLIVFKKLNLNSGSYQIESKLDFIFCRNVFIYFNHKIRARILEHFYRLLKDNGYLFLGHSESINNSRAKNNRWKLVWQTTYQKTGKGERDGA
ncbi:CheR family methyltransferase [Halothermothrix orenii]|uniref:protein-glutamate O-methyltransferase n=1 Tax=Halothermothrix orenii (strain H 168 / OCM 544 / DSM 9562) TaxID=373903 RepID=B8D0R8_HALOH|nr:protein-glutamate O-methyltransferase CheR [Halothermothrix orenii]ACL71004.1 Protein-glutamate O-methyltransferase [Halothermothrix orenii H 168]